jgi:hypothetical protein
MWLRLRAALVCTLLAALTGVAVQAFLLLHAATGAARAAPVAVSREVAATRAALLAQVASARGDLAGQIQAARQDLLVRTERQVAALRKDVMGEVDQIRTTADRRVGDTLGRADAALAHVEEFRGDLKPVLDHAAGIAKQVDDAAPLFLDCEYNPDCVFNRYVGASKGIERAAMNFGQMSSDVRAALPAAITTWQPRHRYLQCQLHHVFADGLRGARLGEGPEKSGLLDLDRHPSSGGLRSFASRKGGSVRPGPRRRGGHWVCGRTVRYARRRDHLPSGEGTQLGIHAGGARDLLPGQSGLAAVVSRAGRLHVPNRKLMPSSMKLATFVECEAGHVVVSLILIALGAVLWLLKVPKGEDLIPFATGVLARSMIGKEAGQRNGN